jgi:hypothetical protein
MLRNTQHATRNTKVVGAVADMRRVSNGWVLLLVSQSWDSVLGNKQQHSAVANTPHPQTISSGIHKLTVLFCRFVEHLKQNTRMCVFGLEYREVDLSLETDIV